MKVLFLGVDGVLTSYKTGGMYALKTNCLRRLQKIVEETGCEVVLSSTWRKDEYSLRRLKRTLAYRSIKIKDTTPNLGSIRGIEIQAWLVSNPNPDGYKFAIVDDDSDMLNHQLPHFFQTDPEDGLTDTIASRIINHLGKV